MRIFDFNRTRQGTLIDYVSKTAGTATNIDFEPSPKGIVAEYNAALTSRFNAGAKTGFVGDITVEAWVNPFSFGQAGGGRIIDDGQLNFGVISTNSRFWIRSDGATIVYSANDSVKLRHWHHLLITRTAAGVVNFYVNGILSGTANQDSGTPAQGTTNLFVGDNNAGTANFHGYIGKVIIHRGIFTAKQRANSMREFTIADEILENNYPEYQKPSDLSRLQNDGLVAGWNMIGDNDEIVDLSGNSYNLPISGSPAFYQDSIRFKSVNDYCDYGSFISSSTVWTVVMRFRDFDNKANSYICGNVGGLNASVLINNTVAFRETGGAVNNFTQLGSGLEDGINDLIMASDGTNVRLYINGVQDATTITPTNCLLNIRNFFSVAGLFWTNITCMEFYIYSDAKGIDFARAYHNKFARQVYFKTEFLSLGVNTEF